MGVRVAREELPALEHLEDPGGVLALVRPRCRWVYVEVPDFEAVASNAFRIKLDR